MAHPDFLGDFDPDAPDVPVEYRPVVGYPRYVIGSDGWVWARVRGTDPDPTRVPGHWRRLKPFRLATAGRLTVQLWRDGKRAERRVAALRREAFPPEHPGGVLWLGPAVRGSDHHRAKLDEADIVEIRFLRSCRWTYKALCGRFGIGKSNLHAILSGKTWRHVPG